LSKVLPSGDGFTAIVWTVIQVAKILLTIPSCLQLIDDSLSVRQNHKQQRKSHVVDNLPWTSGWMRIAVGFNRDGCSGVKHHGPTQLLSQASFDRDLPKWQSCYCFRAHQSLYEGDSRKRRTFDEQSQCERVLAGEEDDMSVYDIHARHFDHHWLWDVIVGREYGQRTIGDKHEIDLSTGSHPKRKPQSWSIMRVIRLILRAAFLLSQSGADCNQRHARDWLFITSSVLADAKRTDSASTANSMHFHENCFNKWRWEICNMACRDAALEIFQRRETRKTSCRGNTWHKWATSHWMMEWVSVPEEFYRREWNVSISGCWPYHLFIWHQIGWVDRPSLKWSVHGMCSSHWSTKRRERRVMSLLSGCFVGRGDLFDVITVELFGFTDIYSWIAGYSLSISALPWKSWTKRSTCDKLFDI
jgi:hypothetical protein